MAHLLSRLFSRPVCILLVELSLVLLFAACGNERPGSAGRSSVRGAEAFSKKLEKNMMPTGGTALDSAFDLDAFFGRIMHGVVVTGADREAFRTAAASKLNFGRRIMQSVGPDGGFRFLRIRREDGEERALFRVVQQNGGLAYYEFLLTEDSAGSVHIVDAYSYLSGEFASATLRRQFAAEPGGQFARLFASSGETQTAPVLIRMKDLVDAGKFSEATAFYATLPPDLRKNRLMILQRLLAAIGADSPDHATVLAEARRDLGMDVTIDMTMLDYYYMTHRLDSLGAAVDRLDVHVGGDPYLNLFRATIAMARRDGDKAAAYAWALLNGDPENPDGYWAVVNASILRRDYATISRMLDALKSRFNLPITPAVIRGDTLYRDYAASPEFTAWAARQK
ncbi:MAG TPA: hypothetical protein VHI13_06470 [Candidatus Kapabacteria bacterium]|nr:hypothetical protein [Candidatus Kapabacteria bacterium]